MATDIKDKEEWQPVQPTKILSVFIREIRGFPHSSCTTDFTDGHG